MIVFLINLASTWFMIGLIWIIQIVHYPLFSNVGSIYFITYHGNHKILISPLVGSVMIFELVSSVILLFQTPKGVPNWTIVVSIILLSVIWISTLILQVPYHERLGSGFDKEIHDLLVKTNWIRTVCWSLRGVFVLLMLDFFIKNNSS